MLGVIAEEVSDVEVLYELTCKLSKGRQISFRRFVGHGCGKLRRKCGVWALNLYRRGCKHLAVLHDLDGGDEKQLRARLRKDVEAVGFRGHIILIPIQEIEAWLLCDALAIKKVFGLKRLPKTPRWPETLADPKKVLREIAWKYGERHYINTIHNQRIAANLRVSALNVCPSFREYPQFILRMTTK